jgi:hypothetical protein
VKRWGHEHAEAQNLELAMAPNSEDRRFGNLLRTQFGSRARGHARTGGEARPIREFAEDSNRESRGKTFTNQWISKVKVVVPKSPGLECELVADL